MKPSPASEVESFLDHYDYDLALRRILDFSFDTGAPHLMWEAIALSRAFPRELFSDPSTSLPADLDEKARQLLHRIGREVTRPVVAHSLLESKAISKTYTGGGFSLRPVSLSIQTGDILGVVGENGNGKTTLLRCLAGQLAIDAGAVSYQDLHASNYYDIKSYVAFIPQRIPRWYGRLRDNLHFSASIAGVLGDENELQVSFMLERLGLSRFADLTWDQISSGYRTRFELARVLLHRPSLLILDEPLANLDIKAQQTILTDLRFMTKSANRPMGVILSSQQLHEVEKTADRVLFIRNGQCMLQEPGTASTTTETIVELESSADRNVLGSILGDKTGIKFNGGFYTIRSTEYTAARVLELLVGAGVSISYFRDITHSTKRFFN